MKRMMEKAASSVEECKGMLVKMQRQLDRIENEQGGKTDNTTEKNTLPILSSEKNTLAIPSSTEKNTSNTEDNDSSSSDEEEDEMETKEKQNDKRSPIDSIIKQLGRNASADNDSNSDDEEEEKVCGGMRKLAMVSMAGGAILIGGALQHHLR